MTQRFVLELEDGPRTPVHADGPDAAMRILCAGTTYRPAGPVRSTPGGWTAAMTDGRGYLDVVIAREETP